MRTSLTLIISLFIGGILGFIATAIISPGLLYANAEAATVAEITLDPVTHIPYSNSILASSTLAIVATTTETIVQQHPPAPAAAAPKSVAMSAPQAAARERASGPITPARISIPSIEIDAPVIGVGTNAKGEMDVPSGSSNDVGWYQAGVKPGAVGTAVFDAHVFAALKNLKHATIGTDIYVTDADGSVLHFRVTRVAYYALASLSPTTLFARSSSRDINIITCAGTYVRALGTYDHRLIVSATLVD